MHWRTRLLQADAAHPNAFRSLSTPIHRGLTVTFDHAADIIDDWHQKDGA